MSRATGSVTCGLTTGYGRRSDAWPAGGIESPARGYTCAAPGPDAGARQRPRPARRSHRARRADPEGAATAAALLQLRAPAGVRDGHPVTAAGAAHGVSGRSGHVATDGRAVLRRSAAVGDRQ